MARFVLVSNTEADRQILEFLDRYFNTSYGKKAKKQVPLYILKRNAEGVIWRIILKGINPTQAKRANNFLQPFGFSQIPPENNNYFFVHEVRKEQYYYSEQEMRKKLDIFQEPYLIYVCENRGVLGNVVTQILTDKASKEMKRLLKEIGFYLDESAEIQGLYKHL